MDRPWGAADEGVALSLHGNWSSQSLFKFLVCDHLERTVPGQAVEMRRANGRVLGSVPLRVG